MRRCCHRRASRTSPSRSSPGRRGCRHPLALRTTATRWMRRCQPARARVATHQESNVRGRKPHEALVQVVRQGECDDRRAAAGRNRHAVDGDIDRCGAADRNAAASTRRARRTRRTRRTPRTLWDRSSRCRCNRPQQVQAPASKLQDVRDALHPWPSLPPKRMVSGTSRVACRPQQVGLQRAPGIDSALRENRATRTNRRENEPFFPCAQSRIHSKFWNVRNSTRTVPILARPSWRCDSVLRSRSPVHCCNGPLRGRGIRNLYLDSCSTSSYPVTIALKCADRVCPRLARNAWTKDESHKKMRHDTCTVSTRQMPPKNSDAPENRFRSRSKKPVFDRAQVADGRSLLAGLARVERGNAFDDGVAVGQAHVVHRRAFASVVAIGS